MAATHRILDDFLEETFSLYAIHSSLEDYALVYSMNQALKSRFRRLRTDLDIARGISFPIFEWKDEISDRCWTLISNSYRKEEQGKADELFTGVPSHTIYHLVPEHKEVDYFLKMEGECGMEDAMLLKKLAGISRVITVYPIDTDKLKSRKNLIF